VPDVPDGVMMQLQKLNERLDRRGEKCRLLDRYFEGESPLPPAVQRARVTRAYRMLMPVSDAPWGGLIVDSTLDRLELGGIREQDRAVADKAWGVWQGNDMDAESKLAHSSALVDGRANALVWPDEDDNAEISLDDAATMIVQYEEGSRRKRVAALRRWMDEDQVPHATLYRAGQVFKFSGPQHSSGRAGTQWEPRTDEDDEWPMENPYGVVPVVELGINRRLKPGGFPHARGEFEHCVGLIDRIHLLTFLGLVVAFWQGFPLRGVIGDRILRDDDGKPLPPFEAGADSVFQLEDPEAKLAEFKAADRTNLAIYPELDQLATITKTPRHYFPMEHGMSNLSADAIRADEGALHAKCTGYKGSLGGAWTDVLRLGGRVGKDKYELSPRAAVWWMDHESRSLAERADAAAKLKDVMPWMVLAERVLNASQDDINRWSALRGSDALSVLVEEAKRPVVAPPAAAGNGVAGS
jgi:hypothetical protein